MSVQIDANKRHIMADLASGIANIMVNKGLSPEEIVATMGMVATLVMIHDDMQAIAKSEAMQERVTREGKVQLKIPVTDDEVIDRSIRAFSAGLGFPVVITLSRNDLLSPQHVATC